MKLEDLNSDAERIDFLCHVIGYLDGCAPCLRSLSASGTEVACKQDFFRGYLTRNGKICPDLDLIDFRPQTK